jgi:hypothetical protein
MKRILLLVVTLLYCAFALTTVPIRTTFAATEQESLFCYSASMDPSIHQWFYTDIFRGDRANGRQFSDAFSKYLRDRYPDRNTGPVGCRFFGNNDDAARRDKRTLQAASNADSIETGWTYGH